MGKSKPKKSKNAVPKNPNWTPLYIKLPNDAYAVLAKMEEETGKTQTKIVTQLLLGKGIFGPALEKYILEEATKRHLTWAAAVQELFSEAMAISKHLHATGGEKPS